MKNIFESISEVFAGKKKISLEGELLTEANKLWEVKDNNWTPEQTKLFAEQLKTWDKLKTASTPEKAAFFKKLEESEQKDPPADPPTGEKARVFKYRVIRNCVIDGVYRKEGEILIFGGKSDIPHLKEITE